MPTLVGREAELAWLRERWERARTSPGALVTLTGIGGIGKSRLAAELAGKVHRVGAVVVHCSGRGSPGTVRAALSRAGEATRATLLVVDDADEAGGEVIDELQKLTPALAHVPVLALALAEDADALARLAGDGALTLEPLDAEAVRAIAVLYAPGPASEDVACRSDARLVVVVTGRTGCVAVWCASEGSVTQRRLGLLQP